MTSSPPVAARRRSVFRVLLAALSLAVLAACGSQTLSPTPPASIGSGAPSASGSRASASASGAPASPSPTGPATPQPTPRYTNPPDAGLARIIPGRVAGIRVNVPVHSQFAYTPGDMVPAYGDLALRFTSLQVAWIDDPRLSLYVSRVEGELPTTRRLAPYLATAGEYVGIAGLHRKEWKYRTIGGRVAWVRPEDNATAAGTMIYTWTGGQYVFLLIGTDDRVNRALFAALPGEKAKVVEPSTPVQSGSPSASSEASAGS
jgi:hypothetical protein